jgi:hypothetical protein
MKIMFRWNLVFVVAWLFACEAKAQPKGADRMDDDREFRRRERIAKEIRADKERAEKARAKRKAAYARERLKDLTARITACQLELQAVHLWTRQEIEGEDFKPDTQKRATFDQVVMACHAINALDQGVRVREIEKRESALRRGYRAALRNFCDYDSDIRSEIHAWVERQRIDRDYPKKILAGTVAKAVGLHATIIQTATAARAAALHPALQAVAVAAAVKLAKEGLDIAIDGAGDAICLAMVREALDLELREFADERARKLRENSKRDHDELMRQWVRDPYGTGPIPGAIFDKYDRRNIV